MSVLEEPRLLMLETIREYGQELLASGGEAALDGPLLTSWLDRLEQEHDNLRAALHWFLEAGLPVMALRLCSALERFWVVRGYRHEGPTFLERALGRSAGVAPSVRAKALLVAARLSFMQSDYDRGKALAQESLALFRELGDIGKDFRAWTFKT